MQNACVPHQSAASCVCLSPCVKKHTWCTHTCTMNTHTHDEHTHTWWTQTHNEHTHTHTRWTHTHSDADRLFWIDAVLQLQFASGSTTSWFCLEKYLITFIIAAWRHVRFDRTLLAGSLHFYNILWSNRSSGPQAGSKNRLVINLMLKISHHCFWLRGKHTEKHLISVSSFQSDLGMLWYCDL